jgi:cytidylate kinase
LNKRIVVAIDGPAGAGKSTLAKRLAARLNFVYIDTGAMYRAVALWAIRKGVDPADAHGLEQLALNASIQLTPDARVLLNDEDISDAIRTLEVSQAASKISAVPPVRRALVLKQQRMGQEHSVVMEGRDIGTVVFPDAQVKIYLDASPEVRAERRVLELRLKGVECDAEETARQMRERDQRDSNRADSPLIQAPDAFYLDSSHLTLEQVEEEMLRLVRERTSNGKEIHR